MRFSIRGLTARAKRTTAVSITMLCFWFWIKIIIACPQYRQKINRARKLNICLPLVGNINKHRNFKQQARKVVICILKSVSNLIAWNWQHRFLHPTRYITASLLFIYHLNNFALFSSVLTVKSCITEEIWDLSSKWEPNKLF